MKKTWMVLGLVALMGAMANGQVTGQMLHNWYQAFQRVNLGTGSGNDTTTSGEFQAFCMGIIDAEMTDGKIKVPPNMSYSQIVPIIGSMVEDHPEWWQGQGSIIAILALQVAFPVTDSPKKP